MSKRKIVAVYNGRGRDTSNVFVYPNSIEISAYPRPDIFKADGEASVTLTYSQLVRILHKMEEGQDG